MKEVSGGGGSPSFARKSFDSVVMVVSRVRQALNTLIWPVLKFSCGSSLPYMVCLYLWLTERKFIRNPVWSFLLN